jgi:hypothetical protein
VDHRQGLRHRWRHALVGNVRAGRVEGNGDRLADMVETAGVGTSSRQATPSYTTHSHGLFASEIQHLGAKACEARMAAEARKAVLEGSGWLTATEIAEIAGLAPATPAPGRTSGRRTGRSSRCAIVAWTTFRATPWILRPTTGRPKAWQECWTSSRTEDDWAFLTGSLCQQLPRRQAAAGLADKRAQARRRSGVARGGRRTPWLRGSAIGCAGGVLGSRTPICWQRQQVAEAKNNVENPAGGKLTELSFPPAFECFWPREYFLECGLPNFLTHIGVSRISTQLTQKDEPQMTKTLTHADVRDLFSGFAAAIELDQLRADALPAAKLHPLYNESMWRGWREEHTTYINRLLSTVDAIPPAMLVELTGIAIAYAPENIGHIALELFAEAVGNHCPEELETAEHLLAWLIREVGEQTEGSARQQDARAAMLRWLSMVDPLRIAKDPECGYELPAGFMS